MLKIELISIEVSFFATTVKFRINDKILTRTSGTVTKELFTWRSEEGQDVDIDTMKALEFEISEWIKTQTILKLTQGVDEIKRAICATKLTD